MKQLLQTLRRPLYGIAALAMLFGVVATAVVPNLVSAYATPDNRRIKMSSSVAGDTNVTYELSFTANSAAGDLVLDFCGDTPLIGATCAFSAASAPVVTGASVTSVSGGATGTLSTPTSHTIKVTGLTISGTYTITFAGITNPTDVGSFYARVLTYGTGDAAGDYTVASTTGAATSDGGTSIDAGGVAMSTVEQIQITARVMESITFCVYGDNNGGGAGTGTCGDPLSPPSIELGTGTPPAIDSLAVYTNFVNFDLSSNATHGVVVRLKGDTLTSGSNTIPAVGGSAAAIVAGTADFGLKLPTSTNTGPGTPVGQVDAFGIYDGGGGLYGFDTNNTDGTTSTFGDQICDTNDAPLNGIKVPLTYGVTAAITTPAGVYTATHQLIASGTF